MKRILSNFIYQAVFQIVKIIIPIITIPIVSNALGPKGIGIYNYTNSITQYFILLAGLGMALYGNREVAIHRDNRFELSKTFWELEIFSSISSMCMLIFYVGTSLILSDTTFLLVQSMSVLAVMFDISWFFMGIERFKYVSLSNLFVQLITFVLIVTNIKDSSDVILYIAIQSGGILASAVIMWLFVINKIDMVPIRIKDVLKHFKPTVAFFIPQVSIVIYTNLNKTILGAISGSSAVGFFSNGLQLVNVAITLITTLDVVLLPQMSNLFANNNTKKIVEILNKTLHLQLFFSIPIAGGLCSISYKLVPWFFGSKFILLEKIIPILSILVIIIPMGMSISRQYLLPIGHVKEYNISVMIGAGISILLNFMLIPLIGVWGAIIGSIVSEIFVSASRMRGLMRDTSFKYDIRKIAVYIISTGVMVIMISVITKTMVPNFLTTVIQVVIGFFVYIVMTVILGDRSLLNLLKRIRA